MSALRALTSVIRRERRGESPAPYKRSRRPSSPRKASSLITIDWNFFGFFSFVSALGLGPKKEVACVAEVAEDQDVDMDEDDESAPTTEESTTDTSVEIMEVEETTEPVKTTESTQPASNVSVAEPVASIPPPPPTVSQPPAASGPCFSPSSIAAVHYSNEDDVMEWAVRKAESKTPMTELEYLGLKTFIENRSKERTYEPIKLRFSSHVPSVPAATSSPASVSVPSATASSQQPVYSGSASLSTSTINPSTAPSYRQPTLSSSTSLPTFTNNVSSSRVPGAPKRMLKKDPNGSITWRGAGRARNVPQECRKRPSPPEIPRTDPIKRRRIFEETNGSAVTSGTTTSQNVPISASNGVGAGPSLAARAPRVSIKRQHAAPHAPSPLRNVINGSPPPSPPRQARSSPTNLNASSSNSRGAPATKTASASFLAEVIEKATPRPKEPDVANPYQTAAPVKPVIKPMEKKRMSERRARTREAAKQKEAAKMKEAEKKELSAKDIIEATVPKGAKRSRPPPGLNKARAVNAKQAPEAGCKTVVEESAEESAPKKKRRTVTIEEVFDDDDVNVKSTATHVYVKPSEIIQPREPTRRERAQAPVRPSSTKAHSSHFVPPLNSKVSSHGPGKSSLPKEPSKLRTSFLPDEEENETPKTASHAPTPPVSMTTPGTPLAEVQEKKDPKEVALTLPLTDLPTFVFKTPPAPVAVDHTDARVAAKELPVTSLPKFDFSKARTLVNGFGLSIPGLTPFDFTAAGLGPQATASDGEWQCSTCMLRNSASALEKCAICDGPRPGAEKPKKVTVNGKGPSVKPSSTKPDLAPSPTPAVKAFDFDAAGLKPKAPPADGQWQCSSCMLQNPASALEKCKICDTPRSGVEKAKKPYTNGTSRLSNGTKKSPAPAPAVNGFNFAAAGLKPPTLSTGGNWQCSSCMLQNPETALDKCKICDAPRPGTEKKAVNSRVRTAKPLSPVASKAFNWAAAGLAPKSRESCNSWTCGTCMLNNPPTAIEKCKVCDASRS